MLQRAWTDTGQVLREPQVRLAAAHDNHSSPRQASCGIVLAGKAAKRQHRKCIKAGLCRLEGMVDVKSRRCVVDGCNRYPAFNVPGETQSSFCGVHKQPGMIDVHNKRCMHEGCITRPSFNFPGALSGSSCPCKHPHPDHACW